MIVIPVLLSNLLDIGLRLAAVRQLAEMHVGTGFTDEGAQPNEGMGRCILLAIDAVLVKCILRVKLLQEVVYLLRTWQGARLEEYYLLLLCIPYDALRLQLWFI